MPDYPIHDSPYFDVREYVDRHTWKILGPYSAWMVDVKIVRIVDKVRELTGSPTTLNNWSFAKSGKIYDSSGFRAIWDPEGGTLSQHRSGRAADVKVKGWTPKRVYELVLENSAIFWDLGLTTIEDLSMTPTWLHMDCRPYLGDPVAGRPFLIVTPNS